jgi:hypothetical protein
LSFHSAPNKDRPVVTSYLSLKPRGRSTQQTTMVAWRRLLEIRRETINDTRLASEPNS